MRSVAFVAVESRSASSSASETRASSSPSAWYESNGEPAKTSPLFVDTDGEPLVLDRIAADLRKHLKVAGVTRTEPRNANRQPIRAHDLRATMVTISLANGRSEAWVADRTGHRTSTMINHYRRAARSLSELGLGNLASMVDAIPELRAMREKGQEKGQALTALSPPNSPHLISSHKTRAKLAEEEGFEPPVESPLQRISNPPPSTARPLLREESLLAHSFHEGGR
jgi:hypothetical protein